jgi:hypothetical protein
VLSGDAPKLLVDKGQQLVCGTSIAGFDRIQDARDITHSPYSTSNHERRQLGALAYLAQLRRSQKCAGKQDSAP